MKQRKGIALCTALLCLVFIGLANGASNGSQVKVKGLITGRDGENLTLKTSAGSVVVIVLTDDTKVGTPKGLLRIRHSEQSVTALIPGLRIEVDGTGTESRVVAKNIKFEKSDLQLAEVVQAGLTPTQQQAAANKQDISTNKEDISTNKENITSNKEQGEANQEQIATNQQTSREASATSARLRDR